MEPSIIISTAAINQIQSVLENIIFDVKKRFELPCSEIVKFKSKVALDTYLRRVKDFQVINQNVPKTFETQNKIFSWDETQEKQRYEKYCKLYNTDCKVVSDENVCKRSDIDKNLDASSLCIEVVTESVVGSLDVDNDSIIDRDGHTITINSNERIESHETDNKAFFLETISEELDFQEIENNVNRIHVRNIDHTSNHVNQPQITSINNLINGKHPDDILKEYILLNFQNQDFRMSNPLQSSVGNIEYLKQSTEQEFMISPSKELENIKFKSLEEYITISEMMKLNLSLPNFNLSAVEEIKPNTKELPISFKLKQSAVNGNLLDYEHKDDFSSLKLDHTEEYPIGLNIKPNLFCNTGEQCKTEPGIDLTTSIKCRNLINKISLTDLSIEHNISMDGFEYSRDIVKDESSIFTLDLKPLQLDPQESVFSNDVEHLIETINYDQIKSIKNPKKRVIKMINTKQEENVLRGVARELKQFLDNEEDISNIHDIKSMRRNLDMLEQRLERNQKCCQRSKDRISRHTVSEQQVMSQKEKQYFDNIFEQIIKIRNNRKRCNDM